MNLDQLCARPGAGAALLYLHRWLPQHGAFVFKQAFGQCAVARQLLQAGADLTAFAVLAEIGLTAEGFADPGDYADRALMMVRREGEFEIVRDFLAMQAALHEAERIHQSTGRGSLLPAFDGSVHYLWAFAKACTALGVPPTWKATRPDGSPFLGGKS